MGKLRINWRVFVVAFAWLFSASLAASWGIGIWYTHGVCLPYKSTYINVIFGRGLFAISTFGAIGYRPYFFAESTSNQDYLGLCLPKFTGKYPIFEISVPMYLIVFVCFGLAVIFTRRLTRTQSPRSSSCCMRCGYDIRLLHSMKCPECGLPFDRAGPARADPRC